MRDRHSIREIRRNFKNFIEADQPTIIGDGYHERAILLPLTTAATYMHEPVEKAWQRAAQWFKELKAQRPD